MVVIELMMLQADSPSLDETVRELNSRLQEENKNLHQVANQSAKQYKFSRNQIRWILLTFKIIKIVL